MSFSDPFTMAPVATIALGLWALVIWKLKGWIYP